MNQALSARLSAFAAERFPTAAVDLAAALEPVLSACSTLDETSINKLREPALFERVIICDSSRLMEGD